MRGIGTAAGMTKPRASTQQSLYTGGMSQEITEETATTWYNHCLTLDPPVPAEWGVDQETREVIEDDIRTHLARGVGDPELYAEVILDSIDYLSGDDQNTEESSRPTDEAINAYACQVIERHRNLAQELGITREDGNLERAFAQLAEEGILGAATSPAAAPAATTKLLMSAIVPAPGTGMCSTTSKMPKPSHRGGVFSWGMAYFGPLTARKNSSKQ